MAERMLLKSFKDLLDLFPGEASGQKPYKENKQKKAQGSSGKVHSAISHKTPSASKTRVKAPVRSLPLRVAKKKPLPTSTVTPKVEAHALDTASRGRNLSTINVDRDSLSALDRRLAVGADVPEDRPTEGEIEAVRLGWLLPNSVRFGHNLEVAGDRTDVIVGLDIGSTATKIVLRLPFADNVGLPVPAPEWFQADGHPYYWRTLLWKSNDGRYSIEPCAGAIPRDRLKVDLLNFGGGDRETVKAAMIAWIVLVVRHGVGWLQKEQPGLFKNSTVVVDEVNLGMPFSSIAEAHPDQRHVALVAGRILESGGEVTEAAILRLLETSSSGDCDLIALQPELAGALQGFLTSHQRRDGRYLLVDIGGLTVDTVFFIYREAANPPITIFAKSVECFGAEVISAWCKEIGNSERAIKVLGSHIALVAKKAIREKMDVNPANWKKPFELETILIGGGRHSQPHRSAVPWCQNSMTHHAPPLDLRLRELEPDRDDIDVRLAAGRGVGRLLVAMGLSYSRYDAPDIRPPSELPNAVRYAARDLTKNYIGSEQC
jgi:hypothetical protein